MRYILSQSSKTTCKGPEFLRPMGVGEFMLENLLKVRKMAKTRKRYNQVTYPTQDTTWESYQNAINITNKSQEVSPFQAGFHKAAMNRRESMRNTRHEKHKRSTKEVSPWNGQ